MSSGPQGIVRVRYVPTSHPRLPRHVDGNRVRHREALRQSGSRIQICAKICEVAPASGAIVMLGMTSRPAASVTRSARTTRGVGPERTPRNGRSARVGPANGDAIAVDGDAELTEGRAVARVQRGDGGGTPRAIGTVVHRHAAELQPVLAREWRNLSFIVMPATTEYREYPRSRRLVQDPGRLRIP